MLPLIDLRHCDCLSDNGLSTLSDKSVNLILCDLPFGETAAKWDKIIPMDKLWKEYSRVITDDGAICLFATNPFGALLIGSNIPMYKYEWVWEKDHGANFATVNHQPFRVHENILVFGYGATTYTPSGQFMKYNPQKTEGKPYTHQRKNRTMPSMLAASEGKKLLAGTNETGDRHPRSVLKYDREQNNKGMHPHRKPVELLKFLIQTYTDNGDTVLDNAMGSGSCGEASVLTGRKFIGMEKDAKYFTTAEKQIAQRVAAVGLQTE